MPDELDEVLSHLDPEAANLVSSAFHGAENAGADSQTALESALLTLAESEGMKGGDDDNLVPA